MSSELPPPIEPASSATAMTSPSVMTSPGDVNELASRVAALETRFSTNSWLYGPNFLKRAFAMYGHILVASFIVGIIVWAIFFACTLIFGFSMASLMNR